jgi:hypothetical protein
MGRVKVATSVSIFSKFDQLGDLLFPFRRPLYTVHLCWFTSFFMILRRFFIFFCKFTVLVTLPVCYIGALVALFNYIKEIERPKKHKSKKHLCFPSRLYDMSWYQNVVVYLVLTSHLEPFFYLLVFIYIVALWISTKTNQS